MKKFLALFLVALMCISFAACSKGDTSAEDKVSATAAQQGIANEALSEKAEKTTHGEASSEKTEKTTRGEAFERSKYLVDDAGLLEATDYNKIAQKLERASEKYHFDFVIHTTNTFGGKSAKAYADDYYDTHDYGRGENKDGCILVINTDAEQRYISTCGSGIEAFSDDDIQKIGSAFLEEYNKEKYADAMQTFLRMAIEEVKD